MTKTPVFAGGVYTVKGHSAPGAGTASTNTAPSMPEGPISAMATPASTAPHSVPPTPDVAKPMPPTSPPAAAATSPVEEYSDVFARLFRPKAALCDSCFEISVDSLHFISQPTNVPETDRVPAIWPASFTEESFKEYEPLDEWLKRSSSGTDRHEIRLFNVVFAISVPAGVDVTAKASLGRPEYEDIIMLREIVRKLSMGLMYEQKRSRYVSAQAQLLQDIREGMVGETAANVLAQQLTRSRLALELKTLYTDLLLLRVAHVDINRWIRLSVSLSDPSRSVL
jgi:Nitrogen Permease regulator of amino acid transport activity 3